MKYDATMDYSDSLYGLAAHYQELLEEVDGWFQRSLEQFPDRISCKKGCSLCCRGLFDITLLDALLLQQGFKSLQQQEQERVMQRTECVINTVRQIWPDFSAPWLLNSYPEGQHSLAMPEEDETPCVLLDDDGFCLVYAHRPMTCRLNGIPQIDISGEIMSDEWCSLNFRGIDPSAELSLQFHFREIFIQEQLLFRELTRRLLGQPFNELDTLVPAALLINFADFTLPEKLWNRSSHLPLAAQ